VHRSPTARNTGCTKALKRDLKAASGFNPSRGPGCGLHRKNYHMADVYSGQSAASFLRAFGEKDMDGRDEHGHDSGEMAEYSRDPR
jgi:hypothetical protein